MLNQGVGLLAAVKCRMGPQLLSVFSSASNQCKKLFLMCKQSCIGRLSDVEGAQLLVVRARAHAPHRTVGLT